MCTEFGLAMPKFLSDIWLIYPGNMMGDGAMATGRLEQQVASVERGIAFLKQEHRVMLTGLHVEITNLKRRCHDFIETFACCCFPEEEAELAARCEAVQHLLEDQHCMTLAARGKLRAGRARVSALGRSLREEERCFLEELKRRSHKITLMNRELQRQDSATSSLCRELHSARLKLFQQKQGEEGGGEETDETAKDQQDIGQEEDEEEDDDNDDYEDDSSDWLLSPPPPESPGQSESYCCSLAYVHLKGRHTGPNKDGRTPGPEETRPGKPSAAK
uniref:CCDC92/74 N-terminal domain-containing protein n=1 Tax=Periophthalmus magnuspinnatus TaxID=409849 RepID=A0A3B3ZQ52_9GOBI